MKVAMYSSGKTSPQQARAVTLQCMPSVMQHRRAQVPGSGISNFRSNVSGLGLWRSGSVFRLRSANYIRNKTDTREVCQDQDVTVTFSEFFSSKNDLGYSVRY